MMRRLNVVLYWTILGLGTVYSVLCTSRASAHPLLNRFYERTADVRLSTDTGGQLVVEINYQVEVNQLIALLDAKILLEQKKEEEPGNAKEYYNAFTRLHEPLFADRIYAALDDKALEFTCVERKHRLNPKDGTLHCEYVFRARVTPNAAGKHTFTIEEGAY